jgi:hypothetical protein
VVKGRLGGYKDLEVRHRASHAKDGKSKVAYMFAVAFNNLTASEIKARLYMHLIK